MAGEALNRLTGSNGSGGGFPLPELIAAVYQHIREYGKISQEEVSAVCEHHLAHRRERVNLLWKHWKGGRIWDQVGLDLTDELERGGFIRWRHGWAEGGNFTLSKEMEVLPGVRVTIWPEEEAQARDERALQEILLRQAAADAGPRGIHALNKLGRMLLGDSWQNMAAKKGRTEEATPLRLSPAGQRPLGHAPSFTAKYAGEHLGEVMRIAEVVEAYNRTYPPGPNQAPWQSASAGSALMKIPGYEKITTGTVRIWDTAESRLFCEEAVYILTAMDGEDVAIADRPEDVVKSKRPRLTPPANAASLPPGEAFLGRGFDEEQPDRPGVGVKCRCCERTLPLTREYYPHSTGKGSGHRTDGKKPFYWYRRCRDCDNGPRCDSAGCKLILL